MPKFQLGQRVRYRAIMFRCVTAHGQAWTRIPLTGTYEGIIVGKRTVSDPAKYHSFWLVAPNLNGYRYVAEEDIVAVEVAKGGGVDGYHWEKTGGEDDDTKQG